MPKGSSSGKAGGETGCCVIGVVGRSFVETSNLLNRLVGAPVFGIHTSRSKLASSSFEGPGWPGDLLDAYHDSSRNVIYVQLASSLDASSIATAAERYTSGATDFQPRTWLEHRDKAYQLALFLLLLVSHTLVFLQEGPVLDTNLFRTLRTLQAAKLALMTGPPGPLAGVTTPSTNGEREKGGRSGGRDRNSKQHHHQGGSRPTLHPGRCLPAASFVFLEDVLPAGGKGGDGNDLGSTSTDRGWEMVKALQQTLEAQVRFLLKKSQAISGWMDSSGSGGAGPLLVLDSSHPVMVLPRAACCAPSLTSTEMSKLFGEVHADIRIPLDAEVEAEASAAAGVDIDPVQPLTEYLRKHAE
ncbi:hypothetical protein CYMTET_7683, partial [Cymbomonas tetramitiformis]